MKTAPKDSRDTSRAWVEVDLDALRRNYRRLEEHLDGTVGLLPMLKADGYGLGAVQVGAALGPLAPWGYGLATAAEGAELRAAGLDGRLIVFSPCPTVEGEAVVEKGLEPAVSSPSALEAFGRAAAQAPGEDPLPVHLEVDTGMGRLGLVAEEREAWIPVVRRMLERTPLEVASTFTHFHSAETDERATREQAASFRSVLTDLREAGIDPGAAHLSNSAGILRHPEIEADVARPGIFLYGGLGGEPVASLRARVLDVREVPAGHTVSYGARFRTERRSRLATVGVGYADGLRRELSDRGSALVAGGRVPIRGTVTMDMTVLDVTEAPHVEPGDVATLLGPAGGEEITLEEVATTCGTITYEILTGLGARLPRVPTGGMSGVDPAGGRGSAAS